MIEGAAPLLLSNALYMSTTADFDTLHHSPADLCAECASCKIGLDNCYYQANNVTLCPNCATAVEQGRAPAGSRLGRFAKALSLGGIAAVAGAAIQFAVLHFLNINAALVTILMGIMVGRAVRAGSGNRGGWRYQLLAVLLTYLAISAAYVPMALSEIKAVHEGKSPTAPVAESVPGEALHGLVPAKVVPAKTADSADGPSLTVPLALVVVFLGFLALPVIIGISSPLSILIFGFGLYQAWKVNKATPVEVTGPHWRTPHAPPLPV